MNKFKKYYERIPYIVEALQYTGTNYDEMKAFAGKNCYFVIHEDDSREVGIVTVSGYCRNISEGVYVVKEKDGFYIYGPGVFNQIFKEVNSDD